MDGLKVVSPKALQIPLSGSDARVSQDFGKVKQIPSCPQIANRECMAERVWGASNVPNAYLEADRL